ncbi:MAG: hypothetical protein DK302_001812 [Chloroflexi bacterium]|jgi:hypothetical protein|nr:MAG: hypothetical protein DK302_001812 [Chloroflexota bacterium]
MAVNDFGVGVHVAIRNMYPTNSIGTEGFIGATFYKNGQSLFLTSLNTRINKNTMATRINNFKTIILN